MNRPFARRNLHHFLAGTALCGALLAAAPAPAQDVTLKTLNGNAAISGTLVAFEAGKYTVETVIGQIAIGGDNIVCEGDGCPGTEVAAIAPPARFIGEPIALMTGNGGIRIEGTLLSYTDGVYTVETMIGSLDVVAEGTICEGPGCAVVNRAVESDPTPDAARETQVAAISPQDSAIAAPQPAPAPDDTRELIPMADYEGAPALTISGPAEVLKGMLPALARGRADEIGGSAETITPKFVSVAAAREAGAPSGQFVSTVTGSDGTETVMLARASASSSDAVGTLNAGETDVAIMAVKAPMMLVQKRTETVLGTEGLVAIVSPENAVFQLTPAQMAQVFSGEVRNWRDVGGPDRTIRVFGLPDTHDLSTAMDELVLSPFRSRRKPYDAVFPDAEALAGAVAANSSAIGFVGMAAAGKAKALAIGSECGISTAATPENIRTARYPLSRSLLAISFASSGDAAELIADVESAAEDLVRAAGLEPAQIDRFGMDDDALALRARLSGTTERFARLNVSDALRIMPTSERLSTILTLDDGSSRLDARSKAELERIIDYAADNGFAELFLVGHSEATGDAQRDRAAARSIARTVRQTMEAADEENLLEDTVIRAVGLGAVVPLACAGTPEAVALNRRVEVWVRR
ncbi:phosphate ABC transporter substrate-binding/OmpA family protein [Oceanibium sediminis]|uniref:phosphate ABC transporter substrate-binding/OmpA family protein n=1 Tax=Oceanibium sediminis TaxID=2026339 RepID=UPI0018E5170D|nr:phosphate ABC transporter substrate-binding/OmpA family protein [Oceanibium sediminis]